MNHDSEQRQVPWQGDGSVRAAEGRPCVDWVEAQLSRIELLLCSPVEPGALARLLLHELAPLVGAAQGAAYVSTGAEAGAQLALAAGYAAGDGLPARVSIGEGLLGQCAAARRKLVVRGVGADHFRVRSALGSSTPSELVFLPIAFDGVTLAVLELAFTGAREPGCDALLDRLVERRPSAEPAPRVELPAPPGGAASPALVASPALAKPSLPGRQSFWSTLSHELRSPLNSVIVLSHVLAENAEHNLTEKQVKLARVIHGSGKDLLALVDNMSLLAKIEGQRLILAAAELELSALQQQLSRVFRPLATARGLELSIEVEPEAPRAIVTDAVRVRQILECLLAAAIDRSDVAAVRLRVGLRRSGWSSGGERLNGARGVLAFVVDAATNDDHVRDTGGGAAAALHGTPVAHEELDTGVASPGALARGGALGLAISHELARLLGGELMQGGGSAFTLYLPACDAESRAAPAVPACVARSASTAGASAAPAPPAASEPRPPELAELVGVEIVLIDPDVRQAFTLTGELERQGAAVTHAEDLSEALERLAGRRAPSALLIDAQTLAASPEPAVQQLLRLGERTPIIVLRESGDGSASSPHVHRLPRFTGTRELVALLRRVAVPGGALQTGSR
ncbi:MAG TPA: histidine kinase dimerization/phospho-acceptor domain-containing protein [Polyangiaceae bacterium]|nr:histidine kinase dimerization/phospho-acceptor domain-containing protein [Polyangiaceae bacterium]